MDEQILSILRAHKDEFISGVSLSRKLSLSSSAIARHIHQLREEGYDIQAQPHLGYRLLALPDRLLAQELSWRLETKVIGQKILAYDTVDSSNAVAYALAEQGAPEGTAVFAEAQSKGRGRLGRSWVSPKAQGIYFSLILRPKTASSEAALLTLLAGVSCSEAIREISGLAAQIRWPNDILVNQRKVCGILTEMSQANEKVKFLIVGIGLNVNTPADKLPPGASSLREESKDGQIHFTRLELARELLRQLDQDYHYFTHRGSATVIERWSNFSALSGKRVKVVLPNRTIEGLAQDIDRQGALIVRLDNGFKQHIVAAEAVKVR